MVIKHKALDVMFPASHLFLPWFLLYGKVLAAVNQSQAQVGAADDAYEQPKEEPDSDNTSSAEPGVKNVQ